MTFSDGILTDEEEEEIEIENFLELCRSDRNDRDAPSYNEYTNDMRRDLPITLGQIRALYKALTGKDLDEDYD